jgi:hypothetical protein
LVEKAPSFCFLDWVQKEVPTRFSANHQNPVGKVTCDPVEVSNLALTSTRFFRITASYYE